MKVFGKGGKFNIIDVLVALILVAAIAFVGIKFFGGSEEAPNGGAGALSEPNLRFVAVCPDMLPEVAEGIDAALKGEKQEIGGYEEEMTRVLNSTKLMDAAIVDWSIELGEDGLADMYFTVEANAVSSGGSFSIGEQEIRVGKAYTLKTLCIELMVYTLSMEKVA